MTKRHRVARRSNLDRLWHVISPEGKTVERWTTRARARERARFLDTAPPYPEGLE